MQHSESPAQARISKRARPARLAEDPDEVLRPRQVTIFDTVLNGVTVRGSIVGTRLDLQEALDFAGDGKVKATISTDKLENINDIFSRMNKGDIQGRVVIDFEQAT